MSHATYYSGDKLYPMVDQHNSLTLLVNRKVTIDPQRPFYIVSNDKEIDHIVLTFLLLSYETSTNKTQEILYHLTITVKNRTKSYRPILLGVKMNPE
jgi:hypothetical protein